MSDYQKVVEFNKAFDFPQFNDFTDKFTLNLRLSLIEEELGELTEAYNNKDHVEEQDACADILYVAYGMAWTYKKDSDEYFKCYKSDDTGKKPSFKRRFIAEQCLNRAQVLDNVFSKLFYDTLSLPKNYLYLKLTNLKTREIPLEKAPSDQERNQERNEERNQERNYDKRGGTKKYSIYNKKTRKR